MQYRFPNITCGYLGILQQKLSLNAAFYAYFFNNYKYNNTVIFPQRVPKIEFFQEIINLENQNTAILFEKKKNDLAKKLHKLAHETNANDNSNELIIHLNLLLRYGLSTEISTIEIQNLKKFNLNDRIEMELIRQIAKVHLGYPLNKFKRSLSDLGDRVISNPKVSTRIKMIILNYIIISVYRFGLDLETASLKNYLEHLHNSIKDVDQNNFGDMLRSSIAHRGLAMVTDKHPSTRHQHVLAAERIARNLHSKNVLEDLVAKENLYTCLQTLAKWNYQLKNSDLAQSNLEEMIKIDPYDSTAYAELGFFFLNNENFEKAAFYFHKASKLGPPAVGMHTYYYGKSSIFLNKFNKAIRLFYKASKIDKQAVSPWLDLIDYYKNINHPKRKKISRFILENEQYYNQLQKNELNYLKNLLEE